MLNIVVCKYYSTLAFRLISHEKRMYVSKISNVFSEGGAQGEFFNLAYPRITKEMSVDNYNKYAFLFVDIICAWMAAIKYFTIVPNKN